MLKKRVVIIDYNIGNIASIINMTRKIGYIAKLSNNPAEISKADALLLPGVGAFDSGMKNLKSSGLITVIEDKVLNQRTPILGICLGMQLLTKKSEEGVESGLGWINCETVKIKASTKDRIKIPHMGWNSVHPKNKKSIFKDFELDPRFYFVHSFCVDCRNSNNILGTTHYGNTFASSIYRDNIYGVQFHPEKSHRFGMQLLKNFLEL